MDLIDPLQALQIRQTMFNIADTFAFPISIKRTTYSAGAFASAPLVQTHNVHAIRLYASSGPSGRFRNPLGATNAGEFDLFIGWHEVTREGLIDNAKKPLIDNSDLVVMEGEIYEVVAFAGIADMTKEPVLLQIRVKRRFQSPNGARAI